MNYKQVFYPSGLKIGFTLTLYVVVSFIVSMVAHFITGNYDYGFPLVTYLYQIDLAARSVSPQFQLINFIINLVFWYIISCIIVNRKNRNRTG